MFGDYVSDDSEDPTPILPQAPVRQKADEAQKLSFQRGDFAPPISFGILFSSYSLSSYSTTYLGIIVGFRI